MLQIDEKPRKLKAWKITYFTGNFFSSGGEQMHTAIIQARSEKEAEMIFTSTKRRCDHLAMIEEVSKRKVHNG